MAAGLTQADLASRMGVSQPLVAQWEAGKKDPSAAHLALLSEILRGEGSEELHAPVSRPERGWRSYPSAPTAVAARRAWVDARNAAIRAGGREMFNPSGTEGHGELRKPGKKKARGS